jgi:hypothetical protein
MDDTRQAVEDLYEAYGTAFSAMDPEGAASYWHAPSIRAFPDRVAYTPTAAARTDEFESTIEEIAETPYDHSEAVSINVHVLSDSLVLGNPVWDRLDADGERIVRFSPLHLLRRTDDGWRLTGRSSRASNQPLEFRSVQPEDIGLTRGNNIWPDPPREIREFLEEYGRAFETLDPDEILPYWHLPTAFVTPEGVRGLPTPNEAEEMVAYLQDELEPQDYAQSEAVAIYAHELDDGLVVADVLWHRYDTAGERIDRFASLMLLRETDDGWTIVLVSPHSADTMVSMAVEEDAEY